MIEVQSITNCRFDSDLTISIDPGLDITIPNHQFVVPNYGKNSQGQQFVNHSNNREVLISINQGNNILDMPTLGLPFFMSAYILVDEDHGQFTLWKSAPKPIQKLVGIGTLTCDSLISATTTQPSPLTAQASPSSAGSASKGVIFGAVAGGLAGLASFLGMLFLLRRRRAQHRQARQKEKTVEDEAANGQSSDDPSNSPYYKSELPSDTQPPQEHPLVRDLEYTASPYEMDGVPQAS